MGWFSKNDDGFFLSTTTPPEIGSSQYLGVVNGEAIIGANIFRDMFGIEKLYDYEEPPITKVHVPDLRLASVYIENFKFVMADQAVKLPYKINKTVNIKDGRTDVTVELILLD